MINLLIARHGNTFDPGDTILRVGKQTDLPLSTSGREQARKLGVFLKKTYNSIDQVMVSELQRTQQTAQLALPTITYVINPFLNEIDYGVDDGKPEAKVIERIGEQALKDWEEKAVPPNGWHVSPGEVIAGWHQLANQLATQYDSATILVVTSNGIARFAPSISHDAVLSPKMKTGALSCFQFTKHQGWKLSFWNMSMNHE